MAGASPPDSQSTHQGRDDGTLDDEVYDCRGSMFLLGQAPADSCDSSCRCVDDLRVVFERQAVVDRYPKARDAALGGRCNSVERDPIFSSCLSPTREGYDLHQLSLGEEESDVQEAGSFDPGVKPGLDGSGDEACGSRSLANDSIGPVNVCALAGCEVLAHRALA